MFLQMAFRLDSARDLHYQRNEQLETSLAARAHNVRFLKMIFQSDIGLDLPQT